MFEQLGARARRVARLHRRAQRIDRAQRLGARRDHEARAHADPQRGDVRGLEAEFEVHVVDDRDQRVVGAFDARGGQALVQRLVEGVGEVRVPHQPALGMRMAQVEMQPDVGRVLRRAFAVALLGQPCRSLRRVDGPRGLGRRRVEQVAGDQSGFVAAIGIGDRGRGPAAIVGHRRVDAQPVPDVADTPVQQRRKGGDPTARAPGVGEHLLIPALPALRAVLAAGHDDALVSDGTLALPYAGQHQDVAGQLDEPRLKCCRHRIDLDLARAPAECVVVGRRDASA